MRDFHFEKMAKRAIAAYTRERNALLESDLDALQTAQTDKADILRDLDAVEAQIKAAPFCETTSRNREGLENLFSIIARRTAENEQLARANAANTRDSFTGG